MIKITKIVSRIQLAMGVLSISIFFVVILLQVFARYLRFTVTWTGEVSTYSFIWAVFMGAGVMAYENRHFAFDMLKNRLPLRKRLLLHIFIQVTILVFAASTFYFGMLISTKFWNYRWIDLGWMKMGYTWLCVPFLGASVSLYSISFIVSDIKSLVKGGTK